MAGAVQAGKAYILIGANSSPLSKELRAIEGRFASMSGKLASFSAGVGAMGAAIVGPMTMGVKAAADFEKQVAMVSTMMGGGSGDIAAYRAQIRALSVEFGQGTDVIANGLYDLLSASVAPDKAMGVLRTALVSAKGGMTDAATATSALINILNAYHIPAQNAADVSDLMFMVVKRGVMTFNDLAENVGAVTATANAAGISLEELGASLATMTRNGLKTDLAVTALQNIVAEFLNPTEAASEVAKKYGVELGTAALRAEGLFGVLQKLSGASEADIGKIFGNIRGLRGVFALRGDMQGFAKDLDLMGKRSGAAAEAAGKMSGTMALGIEKLTQAFTGLNAAVGDAAYSSAKKYIKSVKGMVESATLFVREHKASVQTVGEFGVALSGVAAGAMALSLGTGALGKLAGMGRSLIPVGQALEKLKTLMLMQQVGAFGASVGGVTKSLTGLNIIAAASGVSLRGMGAALALAAKSAGAYLITLGSIAAALGSVSYLVYKLYRYWEDTKAIDETKKSIHGLTMELIAAQRQLEQMNAQPWAGKNMTTTDADSSVQQEIDGLLALGKTDAEVRAAMEENLRRYRALAERNYVEPATVKRDVMMRDPLNAEGPVTKVGETVDSAATEELRKLSRANYEADIAEAKQKAEATARALSSGEIAGRSRSRFGKLSGEYSAGVSSAEDARRADEAKQNEPQAEASRREDFRRVADAQAQMKSERARVAESRYVENEDGVFSELLGRDPGAAKAKAESMLKSASSIADKARARTEEAMQGLSGAATAGEREEAESFYKFALDSEREAESAVDRYASKVRDAQDAIVRKLDDELSARQRIQEQQDADFKRQRATLSSFGSEIDSLFHDNPFIKGDQSIFGNLTPEAKRAIADIRNEYENLMLENSFGNMTDEELQERLAPLRQRMSDATQARADESANAPQYLSAGTWSADLASRQGFGTQSVLQKQVALAKDTLDVMKDTRDALRRKGGFR